MLVGAVRKDIPFPISQFSFFIGARTETWSRSAEMVNEKYETRNEKYSFILRQI
jgi:hypothetical protein